MSEVDQISELISAINIAYESLGDIRAEMERLESQNIRLREMAELETVKKLRTENMDLKTALKFYGNEVNWSAYGTLVLEDGGLIARKALEPK